MLLCIDRGAVSAEEKDPRLRELIDRELTDDRRDVREGVGGRGFLSSFSNSPNNLSSPSCICREIIGKKLRSSLNDLTSFFGGSDELDPPDELPAAGFDAVTSFLTCIVAGMIGVGSHIPTRGFDIKYTSHGCASKVSGWKMASLSSTA
jgi:hypothetical protein